MGDDARAANLQPSEKHLLDNLTVGRVVFVQWNDQGWFQSVVKRPPWKNKTTGEWQIRVSFTMDNTEWTADVMKDVCFENPDAGAVEKIVGQRMEGSEMQYEVKWKITPMGQEWANAWHTEAELRQMDYEGWREQLDAWLANPVDKTKGSKKSSHKKSKVEDSQKKGSKKSMDAGTEKQAASRAYHVQSPETKAKSPSTKKSTSKKRSRDSLSPSSSATPSSSNRISIIGSDSIGRSTNNSLSSPSSAGSISRSSAASALGNILSSSNSLSGISGLGGISSLSTGSGLSGISGLSGVSSLGGIGSLGGISSLASIDSLSGVSSSSSSVSASSLSSISSLGGISSLNGIILSSSSDVRSANSTRDSHSKNGIIGDGGSKKDSSSSKEAKKSHKKKSKSTSEPSEGDQKGTRTPPPSKKKRSKDEKSGRKSVKAGTEGTDNVTQSKASEGSAVENGATVLSETVDNGEPKEMRTPSAEERAKKEEKRGRKASTEKKEKKPKREKRGRPSLLEGALNLGSQLEGEETKGEGTDEPKPKRKRKPRAPKDPNAPKTPRVSKKKKEKTWSKLTRQQIIDLAAQFVAEGPEKQETEDEQLEEAKHQSSKKNKDLLGPGKKPRPVMQLPSLSALSPSSYQIPQQSSLTPMTASSIAAQEAAAAAVAIAVAAARAGLTTAPRKFVIAHNDSSEEDSSEDTDYSLSNTSGGEDDVPHSSKKHKPKKRKDPVTEELLEPQSAEKRKPDSPLHFAQSPSRSSSSPPLIIQSMPALGETQFGTSPMSREPQYDEVEQLPVPILSSEPIVEPQSDQPDDGGSFSLAAALSDGAVEFLTPPQPAARSTPSGSVDSF